MFLFPVDFVPVPTNNTRVLTLGDLHRFRWHTAIAVIHSMGAMAPEGKQTLGPHVRFQSDDSTFGSLNLSFKMGFGKLVLRQNVSQMLQRER